MDVENYLKQKRELERKKDLLEAKERYKETKEEPKRPARPEPVPMHEQPRPEPTVKPWMLWDMIILIIVVALFSTLYLFPQYNSEKIKEIIRSDPSLITGMAVFQEPPQTNQQQTPDGVTQTTQQLEPQTNIEPSPTRTRPNREEEILPGPEFTLMLRDRTLGDFDDDGKIDDQIIEITSASANTRYEDLIITIQNEEGDEIQCEVDKDIKIDEDMDGDAEGRDYGRVATMEIDARSREEKRETIPATPEEGSYNGVGKLTASYKAKCYFCLDSECNAIEEDGESEKTAKALLIMRRTATNVTG